ncbi:Collagen alpha-1(XXVII) chain B, partial [Takifugu flavidus]
MEPDNAPYSTLKTAGVGGLTQAQDVDVLQQLGLFGRSTSAHFGSRSMPNGIIPSKRGVILTPRARVQVPVHAVIPATYAPTNLSLVLSLSVHRINSAFLFSVLSKKKKVQLGVQFAPGKVVVHVGQRSLVKFDYDVHDGQWHNLALDVQGRQSLLLQRTDSKHLTWNQRGSHCCLVHLVLKEHRDHRDHWVLKGSPGCQESQEREARGVSLVLTETQVYLDKLERRENLVLWVQRDYLAILDK